MAVPFIFKAQWDTAKPCRVPFVPVLIIHEKDTLAKNERLLLLSPVLPLAVIGFWQWKSHQNTDKVSMSIGSFPMCRGGIDCVPTLPRDGGATRVAIGRLFEEMQQYPKASSYYVYFNETSTTASGHSWAECNNFVAYERPTGLFAYSPGYSGAIRMWSKVTDLAVQKVAEQNGDLPDFKRYGCTKMK